MTITINGEQQTLPHVLTVDQLLARQGYNTRIAIAINGTFIPRDTYSAQELRQGDSIEILAPMQGG